MAAKAHVEQMAGVGFLIKRFRGRTLPAPHVHADIEVLIIERGGLHHDQVGGDTHLAAGDAQCLWGGLPHRAVDCEPGTRCIAIYLPLEWFADQACGAGLLLALLSGRVLVDRTRDNLRRATAWVADFAAGDPLSRQVVRYEVMAWLLRLARSQGLGHATTGDGTSGAAQQHALRMAGHVLAHYREELDVVAVARAAHLSRGYALAVFKQVMGVGLWQFILQVRITNAMHLLIAGQDTILEVAYQVGFNSFSTFHTAFRRVTGRSPREYRQRALLRMGGPT
jgi:AraC-like DNA-binding protein